MTDEASAVAKTWLGKAQEFLLVAELIVDDESFTNACISLSAISGINSSDCLLSIANSGNGGRASHEEAVTSLRRVGKTVEAKNLGRLLGIKNRAEYHPKRTTLNESKSAFEAATKLYESASEAANRE